MKISILLPSLATNGILRAWIIAQLISRHHEVEAIGFLKPGEQVFPWMRDYPWKAIVPDGTYGSIGRLERAITGDIVLAYGTNLWSFGAALFAKRRRGCPIILDMPEWETWEHYRLNNRLLRAVDVVAKLAGPGWSDPHSFKYRYLLDRLTGLADERTVACDFLKRRYGGVLLPFCVNTNQFDPEKFDKSAIRRKWGIPEDTRILFFGGNPQPMKGLEETLAAIKALQGKVNARLVIAGRDATHPYTKRILELSQGNVILLGPQPFEVMPELLAMADIIALPQNRHPRAVGYAPAKIYEAMAMAIPVISSSVGDIPSILGGCGYVISPDEAGALQSTIEHVLLHADEAREMGRRARARAIERYSWDVGERVLQGVVEQLVRNGSVPTARSGAATA